MLQKAGVLHILTCKCASHHSGVPFLNISTSKSGTSMWCFVHFDWQMCFAPQRRAIFSTSELQKVVRDCGFCAFWLANVLFATAACHFRGSQLQKRLPRWGVLCILTCRCASRHSGVQFFDIRTSKSGPRLWVFCAFWLANVLFAKAACHFSPVCWTGTSAPAALARLLFEHQQPRIIEKTQRFATSLTFRERWRASLVTLHTCGSPFCCLDISTLLDTSTLLFNSAYCRKLDF